MQKTYLHLNNFLHIHYDLIHTNTYKALKWDAENMSENTNDIFLTNLTNNLETICCVSFLCVLTLSHQAKQKQFLNTKPMIFW